MAEAIIENTQIKTEIAKVEEVERVTNTEVNAKKLPEFNEENRNRCK
jgi:hypothetical protein